MTDILAPNAEHAWSFFDKLFPNQSRYVEVMNSEGNAAPYSRIFNPNDKAEFVAFINECNSEAGAKNVYFLANYEFLVGNRGKANISHVIFLHVDLDCKDYNGTPDEQLDKITGLLLDDKLRPKGVPRPSAVWLTGGGAQAVWRLAEPMLADEAAVLNQQVLHAMNGGMGTHDVSRLLRLPGTINWLNDKKRKSGRVPASAKALDYAPSLDIHSGIAANDFDLKRYKVEGKQLAKVGAVHQTSGIGAPEPLPADLSEIVPPDPNWALVIATGNDPAHKSYSSRSERVYALIVWLLSHKVRPEIILSILLDPQLGISAHILENPQPLAYATRQIERAMQYVAANNLGWPKVDDNQKPVKNWPDNIRHGFLLQGVSARHNQFSHEDEIDGPNFENRDIKEIADILCSRFQREYDFWAGTEAICRELTALAHENQYHPIKDYLTELSWDGVQRLDRWLIDYCQAEDSELHREFGARTLIGAVKRIMQPGSKFDTILILEGLQGVGKSRIVFALSPNPEWVNEGLSLRSDDKTKAETLLRAWIVELAELDGMTKTTIQALKSFLSKTADTFRPAYARKAQQFKRHCVIIGTTNDETYLTDYSGNRRFWPVTVGKVDVEAFVANRDQLWAEAMQRHRNGEMATLPQHLWFEAAVIQGERMIGDPFEDILRRNFEGKDGRVRRETIYRILKLDPKDRRNDHPKRILAIMTELGWREGAHRFVNDLNPAKGYIRGEGNANKIEWKAECVAGEWRATSGKWVADEHTPF